MEKIGRPLKFESPTDLQDAINEYLKNTPREELTVTGLALAIGTSRRVLDDYMARDDYREIVEQAKCIIENSYEISLRKNGRSGDIFALKNFGWRDQQHIEEVSKQEHSIAPDTLEAVKQAAQNVAEILKSSRN